MKAHYPDESVLKIGSVVQRATENGKPRHKSVPLSSSLFFKLTLRKRRRQRAVALLTAPRSVQQVVARHTQRAPSHSYHWFTGMAKKEGPSLRDVALMANGSQDASSHNLGTPFLAIPVVIPFWWRSQI